MVWFPLIGRLDVFGIESLDAMHAYRKPAIRRAIGVVANLFLEIVKKRIGANRQNNIEVEITLPGLDSLEARGRPVFHALYHREDVLGGVWLYTRPAMNHAIHGSHANPRLPGDGRQANFNFLYHCQVP